MIVNAPFVFYVTVVGLFALKLGKPAQKNASGVKTLARGQAKKWCGPRAGNKLAAFCVCAR